MKFLSFLLIICVFACYQPCDENAKYPVLVTDIKPDPLVANRGKPFTVTMWGTNAGEDIRNGTITITLGKGGLKLRKIIDLWAIQKVVTPFWSHTVTEPIPAFAFRGIWDMHVVLVDHKNTVLSCEKLEVMIK